MATTAAPFLWLPCFSLHQNVQNKCQCSYQWSMEMNAWQNMTLNVSLSIWKNTLKCLFWWLFQQGSWATPEGSQNVKALDWKKKENCCVTSQDILSNDNSNHWNTFWITQNSKSMLWLWLNKCYLCIFNFYLPDQVFTECHFWMLGWRCMSGWQNVVRQLGNLTIWFMKAHHSQDHTDYVLGKRITCRHRIQHKNRTVMI